MRKPLLSLAALLVAGTVQAQTVLQSIPHGSTSVVLNCIELRSLSDTPAGGTLATGLSSSTAGLAIDVRADNTNGWIASYTQSGGTIGTITTPGSYQNPGSNALFREIASGAGCYQVILGDSIWATSGAKAIQIKISDTSSPTFADKIVTVDLNSVSAAVLVDMIADEPCSGHTTADTIADQVCDYLSSVGANVTAANGAIADLTDGTTPVWTAGAAHRTGTCSTGSTTSTCVDAGLTETDVDYYQKGFAIQFNGGTLDGQSFCVYDFAPATDTLSFRPAATQTANGVAYTLISNPICGGVAAP